ncbi:MAG: Gfo/Idh/MocA family protein [Sphingomonas sp.]
MVKLGFLGTGWIGRSRMEAMLATGRAEVAAIYDPDPRAVGGAKELVPGSMIASSIDELLACDPDGVVIATPSALHAEQCLRFFEAGVSVFCQKPLGRSAAEVKAVLDAASKADLLLGVDLSYRHTSGMRSILDCIRAGDLGRIFAADLTFHNAYGPQSKWFFDPELSGGGCLIDLGVHLVDLLLWLFGFPEVLDTRATLLRDGRVPAPGEVETYATGEIRLANGVNARIACSWNLSAGRDAIIDARFYGTNGGAVLRNENGSFFDFSADLLRQQNSEPLTRPPDDWGGRAAAEWVKKLDEGERFEGTTTGLLETALVLDRLYRRS